MRKIQICMALTAMMLTAPVYATQSNPGDKDAYATAVVCTIVASKKGDQEGFNKSSRAVNFLGDRLGYSRQKQSNDLVGMASMLVATYRERPAEEANDVGRCKRRGFFS